MLCCSSQCPRYTQCLRADYNNKDNTMQPVENLYTFGSCFIQYKDGKAEMLERYCCGEPGKWSMYIPKEQEEKEEMNDMLKVCIEITPYTEDISLDFNNPVRVRSVWGHDDLVEIEHEGHKFIVGQSELEKAASRASHFRW